MLINLHGDTNMTASYLHSFLEKKGFDIRSVHMGRLLYEFLPPTENDKNALKKLSEKINPDAILMSVNSMSFWNGVAVTELFKDIPVIWGGLQPMVDPESCLKHVNIIVRGEGEGAIVDLLKKIKEKKSIDKIENIWIKRGNKIIKNKFRPLLSNLDELPFPDYSPKNKFYILGGKIYKNNPLPHFKYEYNITSSRGCPFSCKYCVNHMYNKMFNNKYLRRRSVNSVMNELREAKKNMPKLKVINFWDDVFINDISWLEDFLEKYNKEIKLPFFAYGNAKYVNDKVIKLLKKSNIIFFDLGLQSGSEYIRKDVFGRIDSDKDILKADKILAEHKITRGYDVIFSEFETEETFREGVDFFLKLKKPFKVQRNVLAYYPNFEITNIALKEKKIKKERIASYGKEVTSQIMSKKESEKFPLMNYYYFFGKKFIPNFFIKYMIKNKWHKKYPKKIVFVGELINKIEHSSYSIKSMISWFSRGEFRYVRNRIFNKKDLI